MKRIGITQRRDTVPNRTEERDALDVSWASLLWSLDVVPVPLCSNIENVQDYLEVLNLDGYIISGGNDIGEKPNRDDLEQAILQHATSEYLPVLGVCRGMQFINHYQGGSLVKVAGHVATTHSVLMSRWAVAHNIQQVNSFHDFGIVKKTLGKDLMVLAETDDGVIEAIKHKTYPWLGIMWHPEREPFAKYNKNLIKEHFGVESCFR